MWMKWNWTCLPTSAYTFNIPNQPSVQLHSTILNDSLNVCPDRIVPKAQSPLPLQSHIRMSITAGTALTFCESDPPNLQKSYKSFVIQTFGLRCIPCQLYHTFQYYWQFLHNYLFKLFFIDDKFHSQYTNIHQNVYRNKCNNCLHVCRCYIVY